MKRRMCARAQRRGDEVRQNTAALPQISNLSIGMRLYRNKNNTAALPQISTLSIGMRLYRNKITAMRHYRRCRPRRNAALPQIRNIVYNAGSPQFITPIHTKIE
jgi:hypothetical protein